MAQQQRARNVPRLDSTGHLGLIHDLKSPGSLPASTPAQIATQSASLPRDALQHLIRTLCSSESLWPTISRALPLQRAIDVFSALIRGFLLRVDGIAAEEADRDGFGLGPGWRGRRELGYVVDAVLQGIQDEPATRLDVQLVILSALLAALQAVRSRKDELYVGGRNLIPRCETAVLDAWVNLLGSNVLQSAPIWLAARTLPDVPSERLAVLPRERFFDILTTTISRCFDDGKLFDGLDDDLSENEEKGFSWHSPSPSRERLTKLHSSPLFSLLGPISHTFGKAIESDTAITSLRSALSRLKTLEKLARRVHDAWSSTRWAKLSPDDSDAVTPEEGRTIPWTMLKTLLFSLTMVHASVVSLLTAAPSPRANSPPPPISLDLVSCTLRTFSQMYFVTTRFGQDGFGAYRGVWLGSLDLLGRAPGEELVRTMESIEPSTPDFNLARIYYLNALEQVVEGLPDDYLEGSALAIAQPVLEIATDREAFESAHSVILAIYVAGKRCADALSPWYCDLLLRAYPHLMSASQIRLAFTAMIRRASQTNDPLAWLLITRLIHAAEPIPAQLVDIVPRREGDRPTPLSTVAKAVKEGGEAERSIANKQDHVKEGRPQDSAPDEIDDDIRDPVTASTDTEAAALRSARGHLLVTLADQLAAVNLTLLLPLLEQIKKLRAEEPTEGKVAEEARGAIVRVVFERLAESMDAPKRTAAVDWWTEHGRELL